MGIPAGLKRMIVPTCKCRHQSQLPRVASARIGSLLGRSRPKPRLQLAFQHPGCHRFREGLLPQTPLPALESAGKAAPDRGFHE